jgi:hypothetical protein
MVEAESMNTSHHTDTASRLIVPNLKYSHCASCSDLQNTNPLLNIQGMMTSTSLMSSWRHDIPP